MTRLEELQTMVRARTDGAGQPRPGYKTNVDALRAEIARLERESNDGQ